MQTKIRDYEYVESGLKNVVLKNITVHECKACGEVLPEIRNIKQVHKWIADYLIRKQGPLMGEEFRFLRKAMGMSAKELAQRLGVNPVTVSRWETNEANIGPQSDRLLRALFLTTPTSPATPVPLIDVFNRFIWTLVRTHRKPKPEPIVIRPGQRSLTESP
jgi:putative zinc finger/helix-turn-helix YgiT family protein